MKVINKVVKEDKRPKIELGDVIVDSGMLADTYLVVRHKDEYVAKSFSGSGGLFGVYETEHDMTEAFYDRKLDKSCTLYKSGSYKLTLENK